MHPVVSMYARLYQHPFGGLKNVRFFLKCPLSCLSISISCVCRCRLPVLEEGDIDNDDFVNDLMNRRWFTLSHIESQQCELATVMVNAAKGRSCSIISCHHISPSPSCSRLVRSRCGRRSSPPARSVMDFIFWSLIAVIPHTVSLCATCHAHLHIFIYVSSNLFTWELIIGTFPCLFIFSFTCGGILLALVAFYP